MTECYNQLLSSEVKRLEHLVRSVSKLKSVEFMPIRLGLINRQNIKVQELDPI